ncbi:hypothetical protein SAMN05443550_10827 [Pedobacter hartonius]|uniref:O-Antigen ligase n=2 Tax=Pedobacter hartonius TaxID=425514 RepID=A0A1H4FNB8_9SPHI|nr:hypothetical protein SAMN05443550_10827 [Pedobacter hartonius]
MLNPMNQNIASYRKANPPGKPAGTDPDRLIKRGIWTYFLLLIFEGALRKWILPGLATPILLIRDPLALWIIALVWQKGIFPRSFYLTLTVIIGIIGTFSAMFLGHGSLPVAIYGARILLIQFPLIFAIGRIMTRKDVVEIGKVLLYISIPMVVLIGLQFYSPQSALVNRGVGGDIEGGGFSGALGYFRPPGTFSFTNGCTLFFGFVTSFVMYFWLNQKEINRAVLIMASMASIMAIPLSISRTLLVSDGIAVFFAVLATVSNVQHAGKMIMFGIISFVSLIVLSQFSFFQTATETITTRFDNASQSEGTLVNSVAERGLSGLVGALKHSDEEPFLGYGIGMGTSVGSKLLTGKVTYLISEGEWGRLVGELGVALGMTLIFIRVGLTFKIFFLAFKRLGQGDILPWMLMSFGFLLIPQGQWSQPTSLGFSILITGLLFAAMRNDVAIAKNKVTEADDEKINDRTRTVQMKLS